MSGPRFPWQPRMCNNIWSPNQMVMPPRYCGQGSNNWQNPPNRPIRPYNMAPFDMAPRGMGSGLFNGGPTMMQGCRPPNPSYFHQSQQQSHQKGQGHAGHPGEYNRGHVQLKGANFQGQSNNVINGGDMLRQNNSNGNQRHFNRNRPPGQRPYECNNRHGQRINQAYGFQGQGNKQNKQKKQKIDKRDLPENNKFSCDICERGFKTEEKYKEHTDNHEKCTFEGCSYVAAPKLVQLHIRLQHYTGLAKKIWSLESKEDIAKWIAERKKNFPTAENIAKRRALNEEKKARGEVLETKQFGKMRQRNENRGQRNFCNRDCKQDRGNRKNRKRRMGQRSEEMDNLKIMDGKKPRTEEKEKEQVSEQIDEVEKLKSQENKTSATGDPLSAILTDSESDSDRDADVDMIATVKPSAVSHDNQSGVELQGGLGMILSCYGADPSPSALNDTESDLTDARDSSGDISSPVPASVSPQRSKQSIDHQRKPFKNGTKVGKKKWRKKDLFCNKKSTLLEKLLAEEIRHERNVILQCVHYIVKNKFFGIGQSQSHRKMDPEMATGDSKSSEMKSVVIDDTVCM